MILIKKSRKRPCDRLPGQPKGKVGSIPIRFQSDASVICSTTSKIYTTTSKIYTTMSKTYTTMQKANYTCIKSERHQVAFLKQIKYFCL